MRVTVIASPQPPVSRWTDGGLAGQYLSFPALSKEDGSIGSLAYVHPVLVPSPNDAVAFFAVIVKRMDQTDGVSRGAASRSVWIARVGCYRRCECVALW